MSKKSLIIAIPAVLILVLSVGGHFAFANSLKNLVISNYDKSTENVRIRKEFVCNDNTKLQVVTKQTESGFPSKKYQTFYFVYDLSNKKN